MDHFGKKLTGSLKVKGGTLQQKGGAHRMQELLVALLLPVV